MSTEFKKESRYIVLKLSRMSVHAQTKIGATLAEIDLIQNIQEFAPECVVVESDWPNYNETWEAIKDITQNAFISRDEMMQIIARQQIMLERKTQELALSELHVATLKTKLELEEQ